MTTKKEQEMNLDDVQIIRQILFGENLQRLQARIDALQQTVDSLQQENEKLQKTIENETRARAENQLATETGQQDLLKRLSDESSSRETALAELNLLIDTIKQDLHTQREASQATSSQQAGLVDALISVLAGYQENTTGSAQGND